MSEETLFNTQPKTKLLPLINNPTIPQQEQQDSDSKLRVNKMISSNNFVPIKSINSKVVSRANFSDKASVICLFCSGANCKKELHQYNPHVNAMEGLHSDWITDDIMAMQRPNSGIIAKYGLVKQFKRHHFGAIINLQQPGEHAACGPPLIPETGLTYNPEDFQSVGIFYYNYGWEDMEITDFSTLMRICSAFDFIVKQGKKIAVHCHAGTGRTGVAIVSWLIYGQRLTAVEGIKLFQQKRHGSLSKSIHHQLLKDFEKYLSQTRKYFEFPLIPLVTNQEIVEQQQKILVGEMKKRCTYIAAPTVVVLQKILNLVENDIITSKEAIASFVEPRNQDFFKYPVSNDEIYKFKQNLDMHIWNTGWIIDIRTLSQTLLQFYSELPTQAINDVNVFDLKEGIASGGNVHALLLQQSMAKQLGLYQFSLLNAFVKFVRHLQKKDNTINVKPFLIRISIALLKKQHILDHCFYQLSLINITDIEIPQVIYLYQVMNRWIENEQDLKDDKIFYMNQLEIDFYKLCVQ